MIRITLRKKKGLGEKWQPLAEVTTDLAKCVALPPTEAGESDHLSFIFVPPTDSALSLRIFVGNVLVASTNALDRVVLIAPDDDSAADVPPLACRGPLLADWVGVTELVILCQTEGAAKWQKLLTLPLAVTAGKLTTEQFDQLFAELERDAGAALLDIHGKTYLGLKGGRPLAPTTPVALLGRLRETIGEVDLLLHRMARQPASRLRTTLSREEALAGQTISEATLAEACRDPGMLGWSGSRVFFREHVRERSQPDYRIAEHQVIADFAEYLKSQLGDLRQRIDAEVTERTERKRWRNHLKEADKPTWWETEDMPRIDELQRYRQEVVRLHGAVGKWAALPFLPPGQCLSEKPPSTPLFRNHPVYRRVFRALAGHFLMYQASLDTSSLLTQARSLPVLYEWWCAVRVIRILSRGLTPLAHDPLNRPIFSTRLAQEGRRFTIDFSPDQVIGFTDGRGARVRFRYQPEYTAARTTGGPAVGVLNATGIRTPDMAIEVFAANAEIPDLIIVLDAKYSSATQAVKMLEVTTKYSKIGDARTGKVLSRQVWALTPAATEWTRGEGLRRYCTVDNVGFWSEGFEVSNPVNGAIQTRPIVAGAYDPLEALLAGLLRRAGVEYHEATAKGD